jgi:hypothetical protein
MHPLTLFLPIPYPRLQKKRHAEVDDSVIYKFLKLRIMKNLFGFMGKVNERVLSLSDAFSDYMDDNYFPGAAEEMDAETVSFEYESFLNNYSK